MEKHDFLKPARSKINRKIHFSEKQAKECNLENVNILLVFTVYSAMSHSVNRSNSRSRHAHHGCKNTLEKHRPEVRKLSKNRKNLSKFDAQTGVAKKGAFRHRFSWILTNFRCPRGAKSG